MSNLAYKFALQKTLKHTGLNNLVRLGDENGDPYKEPIPKEELGFWQRSGAKRKRGLPAFLSPEDLKVLKSVRSRAYTLDQALSICGIRLGYGGIVGLIPGVGDIINLFFSLMLVKKAREVQGGIPEAMLAKMLVNVIIDFLLGLIPIVGDFINIAYKANTRNFMLLEKFLVDKYTAGTVATELGPVRVAVNNGPPLPPRSASPPLPPRDSSLAHRRSN